MNFNLLAARLFVSALRAKDQELALAVAKDVMGPCSRIVPMNPEGTYNSLEIANILSDLLDMIEQGRVEANWNVYIPQAVGLIKYWHLNPVENQNGKTDSEPSDI